MVKINSTNNSAPSGSIHSRARLPPKRTHGFSLVELLVGMALCLAITMTALIALDSHLRESRSLLLEARLMQDMRVAADMMTRQLRRAGFWGTPQAGIWQPEGIAQANPYLALSPETAASDAVQFYYSRDASENHLIDSNETMGFRLKAGVVDMRLGDGGWQAVTDPNVLLITGMHLQPTVQEQVLSALCHRPCPSPSTTCPPRHQVRSIHITLQAQAVGEPKLKRSLQTSVRLRNDAVHGQCPA